ncbi:MAG TPA: conjugal transfer protein TrbI, partial [Noviherbaspirillum sp.]
MNIRDPMSPEASPQRVPPGAGVRRVNDLPAYIVVTLMGLFLVVMALVAMDRSAKHPGATVNEEKVDNASRYATAIVGDQKDGIVQPDKPPPPTAVVVPPPQAEPILVARPDNLDLPPVPPRGPASQAAQREEEERNRIRMAKLQMLEEGVKAKTGVSIAAPRSAASSVSPGTPTTRQDALAQLAAVRQQIEAQGRNNATAAYQARLQQLQAPGT